MKRAPVKDRLLEKIEIITESGCWIWMGRLGTGGYGVMKIKSLPKDLHRASYQEFIGDIPSNLHVLHRCDVRSCINPSHLFAGTHADNMKDKADKGRISGENNPNAKLTEKYVLEIRASSDSVKSLSAKYNVGQATISGIKSGKKWRHIL